MDLARRSARGAGHGNIALRKRRPRAEGKRSSRPRSRPHPSPSPDRVRARPALPQGPAALFSVYKNPAFTAVYTASRNASKRNEARKRRFDPWKIRGLCSPIVLTRPQNWPASSYLRLPGLTKGLGLAENLLWPEWVEIDQADLRLLFGERIGGPGQLDGSPNVLYLPLAGEHCRISLTYNDEKITAIQPGAAFDHEEWARICIEIETSVLAGTSKIGRDIGFSTFRVNGYWRGTQSQVQILPPPDDAPKAPVEVAEHPFILEFSVQAAELPAITNQRRIRNHRRLTTLLNVLLAGTTTFMRDRPRHFWAILHAGGVPTVGWAQEYYFANFGAAIAEEFSPAIGEQLAELPADRYYVEVGHDGQGLRLPDDLDDAICSYQKLSPLLRERFDRAAYWMSMASRQWPDSMSASYASLVSAAEALTAKSTKHSVFCSTCNATRSHDVPGATQKFRALFERYAPTPGLQGSRSKMYAVRSKIVHGADLMRLDQDHAFGWDPPWWNEREMHNELWNLLRVAMRNWLKHPT